MTETWILVLTLYVFSGGVPAPKVIEGFDSEKMCKTAARQFTWPDYNSAKCVRVK